MTVNLFNGSTIIAALPDPTFVIGPDGTVQLANQLAADMLEYSGPDELAGLRVERLAQSASGASLWAYIAPLLDGERQEPVHLNLLFARKDNTRFPAGLSLSALDGAGERLVLLTARDLSDRVKADKAISEQAERYATMRAATMDGVVLTDDNGRLLDVNEAYCQMSGYTRDELLTRSIFDLEALETAEGIRQHTRRILEQGSDRFETRHRAKDGRTYDVEVSITVWPTRRWLFALVHDIAERKQAEEALRKSEQEHKVLLRELYHRTKNNMQVIVAMLELQQMYTSDETVKRILTDMRSRIQSMALVHQKLYQSRSLSRIDLGEYLRDLAALLVESYQVRTSARIILDSEVVPVAIDTAIPCGLVLNELVTNAMKYAFPGERTGEIRVSIRRTDQCQVALSVADSGVGLPEGLNPRQDGRLGMQTLFALVEHQLQGHIEFESRPNEGVTCQVTFPDGPD